VPPRASQSLACDNPPPPLLPQAAADGDDGAEESQTHGNWNNLLPGDDVIAEEPVEEHGKDSSGNADEEEL
jgi:hypothetical protein